MDHLIITPAHHRISSLVRSRSRSEHRPFVLGMPRARSASVSSLTTNNNNGFTLPSYGYGGGYMARSLSRSGSANTLSLFGRSLQTSALDKVSPFHNVAVQRPTPHYSDKYPYVRYSYGNVEAGLGLKTQTEAMYPNYYGIRDAGTKRWLEGKLNAYNTGLFTKPFSSRETSFERPIAPVRSYIKYIPTDDAVDLFKKKCMTVNTLSKYWLQTTGSSLRRERDFSTYGRPSSVSTLTGSYSTRYNPPVTSFASGRFRRPPQYYSSVVAKLEA
uniref:Uncharacterized protein n=1 Tax=Meloidogyne enterolobii TaxID=390850 RepID=A0A6V7V1T8_MELEN|nr:unnamed protein product [Meloidogyne enterolobii]